MQGRGGEEAGAGAADLGAAVPRERASACPAARPAQACSQKTHQPVLPLVPPPLPSPPRSSRDDSVQAFHLDGLLAYLTRQYSPEFPFTESAVYVTCSGSGTDSGKPAGGVASGAAAKISGKVLRLRAGRGRGGGHGVCGDGRLWRPRPRP